MPKLSQDETFIPLRLRLLREQLDLTQEKFAEMAGINYKVYQSMEAARRWNLRWSTIVRLKELHGLSLSEFFAATIPRSRFKIHSSDVSVKGRKRRSA